MPGIAFSDIPSSRQAIVQDADGKPQLVHGISMPTVLPETVLVKTTALALNPSDYKMCAAVPTPGAVVGDDFAATVVAVAEGIHNLKPGDLVCRSVNSSNPDALEDGAFTDYVLIPQDSVLRPANLDSEKAATLGTALATCTLAIWASDTLNLATTPDTPSKTPFPVLVYGGSSATGTMAIQLLRLSGLSPITTCSPRNFHLVRSFGATAVFDYTDANTAAAIKSHIGGRLKHVLACILTSRAWSAAMLPLHGSADDTHLSSLCQRSCWLQDAQ